MAYFNQKKVGGIYNERTGIFTMRDSQMVTINGIQT